MNLTEITTQNEWEAPKSTEEHGPAVPSAPVCTSCERNPVRVQCHECGGLACSQCAVEAPYPFRKQTLQMVADAFERDIIWVKFYCPECHSKRRGWRH